MSTATIPFIFRNGFLPGLPNSLGGSLYNYIDLNETDGDQGLREALRIWWASEKIAFTPSGIATAGTAVVEFEHIYQAPDAQDTGDSDFVAVSQKGAVCASTSLIGSTSTKEPAFRGIDAASAGLQVSDFTQLFSSTSPSRDEYGNFIFLIYYTGSKWRLYYTFQFNVTETNSTPVNYFAKIEIQNTNLPLTTGTVQASGTVSFFGYSLNWHAGYDITVSDIPVDTISGLGLSCSTSEWAV